MQGLIKPTSHASFLRKLLEDVFQQNKLVRKRQTGVPGNRDDITQRSSERKFSK